ncbi:MAG TPA: BamA/TamA family outer membrane protein [Flavobacteriaceae bacterium]|nr:BamA/TamA family outer membrane protein [Flavobacteriaceae bacterium]
MINRKKNISVVLLILIFGLQSCSIRKYIPEDERLYTGAKITMESDSVIDKQKQLKSVLEEALRPKPNKKILGMRPGLYFYYKMQQEKPGFINRFLYKKIGEKPVYQSDVKPFEVQEILINRLDNRGFFYSSSKYEWHENDKKKEASISYDLRIPTPYRMEKYKVDSMPNPIYPEIKQSVQESKMTSGMRFDLANMKMERERIDRDLKMKGYYNFNPNFLIFEADTNQYDAKKFDLFLRLKEEVPEKSVVPYRISKINIYANYDAEDTITRDKVRFNEKNYINSSDYFKPKYLDPFVVIKEGQYYSPEDSRNTARRIATIGAYKFVNIQYKERDSALTDSLGFLEADIYLSPLNKRAVRAELQAVTKSNNFAGPGLALTYSNRNLFRGGETLNTTGKFGYEFQAGGGGRGGRNSIELGLRNELIFPRVLFPVKINTDFFKYDIPKTKIGAEVNYLSRTNMYALLSATGNFGYVWQASKYVTHEITPISINYTRRVRSSKEFDSILDRNPFLKRSFEQQFITGGQYSFTYNGMINTRKKHQFFFNGNIDIAGNSLSLIGKEDENGKKQVFSTEFAQYAKADVDFRYHWNFGKEQVLAARLFGGYGLPYGNSDVMPFVKQYYSGGPYSVRAFRIRALGPGTYRDDENIHSNYYDRTGNIRLEGNIEYRFPIWSFLKGAVFTDVGNIWNSKGNEEYDYKDKFTKNFINELGMGAGVGLRVDVQGFVIRFDFATPFHDPAQDKEERYKIRWKETVFNFGIGYPF